MWSISAEKKIAFGHGSSPVTPTLRRLRQKDQKFGTNLGSIVRLGQERKRHTQVWVESSNSWVRECYFVTCIYCVCTHVFVGGCKWAHVCHRIHEEVRGQCTGSHSLLPLRGPWRSNSRHLTWQQCVYMLSWRDGLRLLLLFYFVHECSASAWGG